MSKLLQEQIAYYQARASEYDEWWYRQGRYDRGAEIKQQWQNEAQVVRDVLHQIQPQQHILELAPGTGIWTQELLKVGEHITVVDASPEMLTINKAKLQSDCVTYIQADLFEWQTDTQYDMVFFGFWLSHVPPEKLGAFLQNVSAMLKPNGIFFMVDSQRNQSATAHNQNMLKSDHIHSRVLNDGREFQIVKVFYDADALQSQLMKVDIAAEVKLTDNFFIYAHGRKVISE